MKKFFEWYNKQKGGARAIILLVAVLAAYYLGWAIQRYLI